MRSSVALMFSLVAFCCVPTSPSAAEPPQARQMTKSKEPLSDMFAEGWKALNAGHPEIAVRTWRKHVQHLPPHTILLFAGVFHDRSRSLKLLRAVGQSHDGLLLKAPFKGKEAWYVLIASDPKETDDRRQYLKKRFGIQLPRGREASYFQGMISRIHADAGDGKAKRLSSARSRTKEDVRTSSSETKQAERAASQSRIPAHVEGMRRVSSRKSRSHMITSHSSGVARVSPPKKSGKSVGSLGSKSVGHMDRLPLAVLLSKARKAMKNGDRDKAIALLGRVLRRKPEMKDARLLYSRLWIENNQPEEALLALAPELTRKSRDWRPWFWNGTALLLMNRLDEAARSLDEALAL
ncbi:tetratricopeptide repeat protein, partial [Candidatus Parcubacteria bacterium]